MFSFNELGGSIYKLHAINIEGKESITPDAMMHSDEWNFDDTMMEVEYNSIIESKRHSIPFQHLVIMMHPKPVIIGNGMASLSLSLAIEAPAPITVRPVPIIEPSWDDMERDELMHIVNYTMAGKNNASALREPSPAFRLRPSGKKKKPSSTVSKPGCIYSKTWEYNNINWNRKEYIGRNKASNSTCHGRIISEMFVIGERHILPSKDEELKGKGHHDIAVRCDQCDKAHYIRETIELTSETMPLFPELQSVCDIMGI